MKKMVLACGIALGLSSSLALADGTQFLFTLGTDGSNFTGPNGDDTQLVCKFYVTAASGSLNAMSFTCNDGQKKSFTLSQISNNQTIRASGSHKVCQLKTNPGFDPVNGGSLTLTYLSKGSLSASDDQYGTTEYSIAQSGGKYVIMTGPDDGQRVFNSMFMKAHRGFLGIVDGIASIDTTESNNPQMLFAVSDPSSSLDE